MIKEMTKKKIWILPMMALIWNEFVYYLARILTRHEVHFDFSFSWDYKIPFISWTVTIYFLCFIFWAIVYVYMAWQEKEIAHTFFMADGIGKFICLFFFLFLPTTISRPVVMESGFWNTIMRFLYHIDTADNLFPSIHCMVSWFCFIGMRKLKECPNWCKWGSLFIAVLICISTLTTKQHVIMDVVGGVGFAEISYIMAEAIVQEKRILRLVYER